MTHPTQIFGVDPGVKNFGCSLINGTDSPEFMDLHCTFQRHFEENDLPIQMASAEEVSLFSDLFRNLLVEIGVDEHSFIVIERFEYRGKFTGKTIELVNLMVAVMVLSAPCPCRLIRPVDWKSFRKRRPDILCGLGENEHVQDSLNMTLYQWFQFHHRGTK